MSVIERYTDRLTKNMCVDTRFVMHASGCTIYDVSDSGTTERHVVNMDHEDPIQWNTFYLLVFNHPNVEFK